jgi:drug/metabolite transporter (DMT)-like permease
MGGIDCLRTRTPIPRVRALARALADDVGGVAAVAVRDRAGRSVTGSAHARIAALAYVGPLATAFAYWVMVEVGRHIRATTISVTLLAVPAVGLLISAVTFHETVNASLGLGVALVSAGVLLTMTTKPAVLDGRADSIACTR